MILNNKIFKITIITIISFIAIMSVANATGIFYYNDVRNQIVFNANISLTGASLSKFMVNTINSDRNPLTISGTQDLQFRFGKYDSTSSFGLNNNANHRVFQIGNDGTLLIGVDLVMNMAVSNTNVKFSVDSDGNLITDGSIKFFGGLVPNGTVLNSNKWNEIIRLNGNSSSISLAPAYGLGFSMSVGSFNYTGTSGIDAAVLSKAGNLNLPHATSILSTPSLCLSNDSSDTKCRTSWSGETNSSVVNTKGLATGGPTGTVNDAAVAATFPFGGMYSFYIDWPYTSYDNPSNHPGDFQSNYDYDAAGNPTGPGSEAAYSGFDCKHGNPLMSTSTDLCTCPSGYEPKFLFLRTFTNSGACTAHATYTTGPRGQLYTSTYDKSCPRLYIFMCTKP